MVVWQSSYTGGCGDGIVFFGMPTPLFLPLSGNVNYLRQAILHACFAVVMALVAAPALAQDKSAPALAPVTVSASANRDPAEKSYRSIIKGLDLFERERSLSPNGALRFKLLARKRETEMKNIEIDVIGTNTAFAVPVADDQTFVLPRNPEALSENAQVVPNRKAQTVTWRADVRTPGLPPNVRRLGDLRLECRVGMASGLVSNSGSIAARLASALLDTPAYCNKKVPLYLFFADRALFSVTLASGTRREVLAVSQLYAAASDDPKLGNDLPECDCEVLVDRTYFLPLGDASWPDDALVEFEYMVDN